MIPESVITMPGITDHDPGIGDHVKSESVITIVRNTHHPVPLDLTTLKALKRSPLGLDLYLWLTYRIFALTAPQRLSWSQLYRQFGSDPAKADNNRTVQDFRKDCLRELKKIKLSWPDLNYSTASGVLILLPSVPHISPASNPGPALISPEDGTSAPPSGGSWFIASLGGS